jgi:hypothetical protein
VSIFQLGFGFLLAPLQALPGVGSAHGQNPQEMAVAFAEGWRCWRQQIRGCRKRCVMGGGGLVMLGMMLGVVMMMVIMYDDDDDDVVVARHTFWLLSGYCLVNFVFNTAGLFVAKHGSAVLNSITYAVLLPVSTLLFCVRPIMGTDVAMFSHQRRVATDNSGHDHQPPWPYQVAALDRVDE